MKKRSKRIPTKQRVKAEKKVREHNRKVRKEKRKNPGKFQKKARANISVPNDCPFKEAILKEVEDAKKRKEAEKAAKRAKIAEASTKTAGQRLAANGGLAEMMESAATKEQEYADKIEDQQMDQDPAAKDASKERSAKSYYKEFAKVVDAADVIIQVLDARDPLGTRCAEVENMVLGQGGGKRVILVLNKADLVPKDNLEAWIKHLRKELPTIAFKSSTQMQSKRLGQSKGKMSKMTEEQLCVTSKSVGVSTLMTLLGNYCRNKDVKTSIRVGIVGYPNVGKSSLINSLKRNRVCSVGNIPGVTKVMQEVQLDSKIKLLDCPGMVLNKASSDDVQVALRNALSTDDLESCLGPVEAILQRCEKQYMQLQYNITNFDNVQEFLSLLAREMGKLKKGGIPDQEAAAKRVISDWNNGKIKYFTHPPEAQTSSVIQSEIVSEYAKEFSLDDLEMKMEEDKEELPIVVRSEVMELAPVEPKVSVKKPTTTAGSKRTSDKISEAVTKLGDAAPPKLKKAQKAREKKERKLRSRRERVGEELSSIMNSAM